MKRRFTELLLLVTCSTESCPQFAVYSLDRELEDDMVCLYLLQLVECIKYDLYLDCALTRSVMSGYLSCYRVILERVFEVETGEVPCPKFPLDMDIYGQLRTWQHSVETQSQC